MDLQTDHAEASLASLSCWNPWRCTGRQAIGPCGWPVETRNHDRKEGRSSKCDEVCVPSGAGDERSLFFFSFLFLIPECVFPRDGLYRTAGWLVGRFALSCVAAGVRAVKKSATANKSPSCWWTQTYHYAGLVMQRGPGQDRTGSGVARGRLCGYGLRVLAHTLCGRYSW